LTEPAHGYQSVVSNSTNLFSPFRRALVAVAIAAALLGVPSVTGLAGAHAQVPTTGAQQVPTTGAQTGAQVPTTTGPGNGQQQVTTTGLPTTVSVPPSTAPPTTAPPVTSAPGSQSTGPGSTSASTGDTPTSTAPGGAATTGAGGATTGPGTGGAGSGGAGPGAAGGVLGGGNGARGPFSDLVHGHPGQAARRAISSAVREIGDLSPLELGLLGLLLLFVLALTAIATTSLVWTLHAWRTPASLEATGFATRATEPRESFSLIVPARHEQAVLGGTLERLASSQHPAFEVLAVVGDDDPETREVAEATAARHPDRVRVLVDSSQPKNKPKALNTALPQCRGTVTAVFDAEDEVHPELLAHVDRRFTDTGADVVQGGVQLMNYHSSWYSLRNVLEYYFWFRSRLHFHAGQRFIPLGGNTVFIRTDRLREAGGWDPECLAEDCEIGVRLSSRGARVAVAYDPELVTREETPGSLRELLKQRTRWNQGFLQVLRKGEWRRLPTRRQRLLARYTLAMPFLQAFTGVLIPLSLATMILLDLPVVAALLTFVPLVPTLATLAVEVAALGEFCRNYQRRARIRDYLRLLLGTFPYHLLLGMAALRAVIRERRGERGWEKTAHVGAHRQEAERGRTAKGTA
jgi:cellulose synthase/poly-beta-1,6-N-acetylglucosamine synthase-like glycosyltransferase